MLEKHLESLLNFKGIQPLNPKGNQPWLSIGRTDAEAETWILWPPDMKSQFFRKDPDTGKDWGQEEKGTADNEVVGWHHWLNGQRFGWTPGDGDGQGGLVWCGSWGCKESDTTKRLNWTMAQNVMHPGKSSMWAEKSVYSAVWWHTCSLHLVNWWWFEFTYVFTDFLPVQSVYFWARGVEDANYDSKCIYSPCSISFCLMSFIDLLSGAPRCYIFL